jgi:chromosome segregation ATPase
MPAAEPAIDALASLEKRIVQAVELVARLRGEKDQAVREAADARTRAAGFEEELQALRAERTQVRGRIEKLLEQIDQLGGQ